MAPSRNNIPFVTKNIAKAFFELDMSDDGPRRPRQSSKPYDVRAPATSHPTAQGTPTTKSPLLSRLPAEVRLRIYEELLVARFDREENPSWSVGYTNQKLVLLHMGRFQQYRTMEPQVLQTCKQIYREANPVLYSQNVFAISAPEEMLKLFAQIGLHNFKLIKSIKIWVPCMAKLAPYLILLDLLAKEATGLRYVELAWDSDLEAPWDKGLGDDVDFVRALGKIKGLSKLTIGGYYAKEWPVYLETEMGTQVQAIRGHGRPLRGTKKEDLSEREWEVEEGTRENNLEEVGRFEKYQLGTRGLMP
jgi:hypothetical protein